MKKILNLNDESQRIQELQSYKVLDTAPDAGYDDLVWMAAQIFQAPISSIGYMDSNRLWLKAKRGTTAKEHPRSQAFCDWVVSHHLPLVVPDLSEHHYFKTFPSVTDDPGLRFYAGYPLKSSNGFVLGTLCVMDIKAQNPTEAQLRSLSILAGVVSERMEKALTQKTVEVQQQSLAESQRLRALGELSSKAAHEINNPLTIILGRAQLMQRLIKAENVDRERIAKDLRAIENGCDRIMKVTKGFLRMSRDAHDDPFEKVSVGLMAEDVVEMLKPRLERMQVSVEMQGPNDLMCECRPIEITQVLINLVGNAIDAMNESKEKKITISWSAPDHDQVCLSVRDSGPGIPQEIRESIMRPFFTTKAAGQGSGLGLSISKTICESHGGSLQLQHTTNQTEFVIALPALQKQTGKAFTERKPQAA